jgi:hypothetical protein
VNSLVRELAGVVADGEAVDWGAVERRTAGRDRTIANLRLIERIAEASGARRLHREEAQSGRLSPRLAPWEGALLFLAGLRAILAIAGTLVWHAAGSRELAFVQLSVAGASLAAAVILLRGAARDRRAVALAGVMLSGAAATAWPTYVRLASPGPGPTLDPLLTLLPEAFLAYWIWSFVAEFPHRRFAGPGDRLFVAMRRISLVWGTVALGVNALAALIPSLRPSLRSFERTGTSLGFWGAIGLLSLLAFPAMALAARRAEPSERRRAWAFLVAIAFGFVPLFVIELSAMFLESTAPSSLSLALELIPALTVPFTTTYGVLAKRILPMGALVHQMGRYLLARLTLNVVVGLPALIGIVVLLVQRERPVAEILSGPFVRGWPEPACSAFRSQSVAGASWRCSIEPSTVRRGTGMANS